MKDDDIFEDDEVEGIEDEDAEAIETLVVKKIDPNARRKVEYLMELRRLRDQIDDFELDELDD